MMNLDQGAGILIANMINNITPRSIISSSQLGYDAAVHQTSCMLLLESMPCSLNDYTR